MPVRGFLLQGEAFPVWYQTILAPRLFSSGSGSDSRAAANRRITRPPHVNDDPTLPNPRPLHYPAASVHPYDFNCTLLMYYLFLVLLKIHNAQNSLSFRTI